MKKDGLIGSLIWIILGTTLCIGSLKVNLGDLRKPGPGFLPFLSGASLALLGLILLFYTISRTHGEEGGIHHKKSKKILVKRNWKNLFFPLLALFGYVLSLETLGFLLTAFIFLFLLFKLTETKKWLMPFVLSASAVILSYLIFSVWLQSQLPKGLFGF